MQLSALTAALGRFVSELQRRKVTRVAAAYVVAGWIILQVAVTLQTAMALSASFSGFILGLLVIGFPVALGLSWFFEITPEGIKRTVAADDGALINPQTTDWILIGMLVVVTGIALFQSLTPRTRENAPPVTVLPTAKIETPALGDKSIAVLPFANLSPRKEDAFFADGLTEEVLNILSQIRGLKVISRTSSAAFQGKETPLPEIAKQLGVRFILEGSVRRDGDDVRITAQLIDVPTDTHLWSKTFEPKLDRVFDVQEEIALAIALALDVELNMSAGPRSAPTKNKEAYRLWLKGLELGRRAEQGDIPDSIDLIKRALALDPNFAEAHVSLATAYLGLAITNPSVANDVLPLARQSAAAAVKLKPNYAIAHAALANIAMFDLRWHESIEHSAKAIELDPSSGYARMSLGETLRRIGKLEQSMRVIKEAQSLDPLNRNVATVMFLSAFDRRDDRAVAAVANTLVESSRDIATFGHLFLAYLAQDKGDRATAEREFRAFMAASGKNKSVMEPVSKALQSRAATGRAIKALHDEAAKDPAFQPDGLLFLIDPDNAWVDALNARLARGETFYASWWLGSVWRLVAHDQSPSPKFKTLMRNAGLVDYWKKHGWPDRCRAKGEDDFECS